MQRRESKGQRVELAYGGETVPSRGTMGTKPWGQSSKSYSSFDIPSLYLRMSTRKMRLLWLVLASVLAYLMLFKEKGDKTDHNNYVEEVKLTLDAAESSETRIEPFSWKPRAFTIHNILTEEECDHLVGLAEPVVEASTVVVDSAQRTSGVSSARTSFGTFLRRYQDAIVGRIEEKVSVKTHPALHSHAKLVRSCR